jgi:putative DNA primase/helicase
MAALRTMGARACVLVCFSDSNLVHVAPLVQGRCFVVADNDKSGAGERAAVETGLPYCMSETVGHDANDDHQAGGLMSVAFKLMQLRRQEARAA